MEFAVLMARLVLAGAFGLAAVAKLSDRTGSRQALERFGIPAGTVAPLALALPAAEMAVAVALIPPATARAAAAAALILLVLFSAAIAISLHRGRAPECRCFGRLSRGRVGWGTLGRNGVLAVLAAVIILSELVPGLGALDALNEVEGVAWLAVTLFAVALAAMGLFALALLGQQGRILLRLEALEHGAAATQGQVHSLAGLPVGSLAPPFALPELEGGTTSLDALREGGSKILLVFADSSCSACATLLPQVAAWQRAGTSPRVVLLAAGAARDVIAQRQKHGLRMILLDERGDIASRYRITGTPAAVLIGSDGTVQSETANGADAVAALAARALNATAWLPPRVGERAPALTLPTLEGGVARLEPEGLPMLVVFWDPVCTACANALPLLRAWDQEANGRLRLFIISRGPLDANRAMRLRVQIALDAADAWSRALGARGVPSGVLIDEQGAIASSVAEGVEALRELRSQALSAGPADDLSRPRTAPRTGIARGRTAALGVAVVGAALALAGETSRSAGAAVIRTLQADSTGLTEVHGYLRSGGRVL